MIISFITKINICFFLIEIYHHPPDSVTRNRENRNRCIHTF
jgi:hypothetical protein